MSVFFLQPQYTPKGDTVFRSVGVSPEDRQKLVAWYGCHSQGRDVAKTSFGTIHYAWRDPRRKKIADFPSCSDPGGVYSAKAIEALREMLEVNGDIYPLVFSDDTVSYFLFGDCWNKCQATPNSEFNLFLPGSLKSLIVRNNGVVLPDVCLVEGLPGLMVSERFKVAAEDAGLTGMAFSEIEILHMHATEE